MWDVSDETVEQEKTFTKGQLVRVTKIGRQAGIGKGRKPFTEGVVAAAQRRGRPYVSVKASGHRMIYLFHVDFWEAA